MHVASIAVFEGDPPPYDEFVAEVERRLHLVPRYRQRLVTVPFGQGRPKWIDDPRLNLRYHARSTALPPPGSEEQLKLLAGRVFSQRLDRDKPLWEMWLAEGLSGGRFALLSKAHHSLVDGISGVDILTVMFDSSPEPAAPPDPGERWLPAPLPSRAQLLGEALVERATAPGEAIRAATSILSAPARALDSLRDAALGLGALAAPGIRPAPRTPYNAPIGSHRRFTWVRTSLDAVKKVKNELGGTVNDIVLASVAGALGYHLRRRGEETDGLELRAMVPVSVRTDLERGVLGNRVAAMMVQLPVWCHEPVGRLELVKERMSTLKAGGQAVGAEVLTKIGGFAPPTIMGQAARLVARQRVFNLVVTNVPGPQFPLYLRGHEMLDPFPMVPLARNQGLGIALMSYNGRINFGLVSDYDLLPDLEELAEDLRVSLAELAAEAGVQLVEPPAVRAREEEPSRPAGQAQ